MSGDRPRPVSWFAAGLAPGAIAMLPFRELWCVDFEFRSDPGERPWVVCMVAQELVSGRRIRMWRDELLSSRRAPFDTSPDAALVSLLRLCRAGVFPRARLAVAGERH